MTCPTCGAHADAVGSVLLNADPHTVWKCRGSVECWRTFTTKDDADER